MDCGTSMAKYILFIFNTLVSILGLLGIVYGVLMIYTFPELHGKDLVFTLTPVLLITIGSITLFIAFLGCCGAIRESVCMITCYAVLLLIILIVQLTIVVLLFTNAEKFREATGAVIDEAWELNKNQQNGVFDNLQKWLHCCGNHGAVDYVSIGRIPPPSCCAEDNCLNPLNLQSGCRGKFQDFMSGKTEISKYVGLGLVVVELVGFIFACCLANNIRAYKQRNPY